MVYGFEFATLLGFYCHLHISASCSFGVGDEAGAANFTNCLALIWSLPYVL
jgi:hypothetical protein